MPPRARGFPFSSFAKSDELRLPPSHFGSKPLARELWLAALEGGCSLAEVAFG
jgi:hypothetical protein